MQTPPKKIAHYHLLGLFEFYDFYAEFLPLYKNHPEYFYDWCDITSIYESLEDCLWGGGRTGSGNAAAKDVFVLMKKDTDFLAQGKILVLSA